MNEETNTEPTPEQAQTDALLAEIDRLNGELAKAGAAPLITIEEQRRRNAEELASILYGPNTGAMSQVGR
jgi:hypothetical protein